MSASEQPFAMVRLAGEPDADGFCEETLNYHVRTRSKPQFKSVLSGREVFGEGASSYRLVTRARDPNAGSPVLTITTTIDLPNVTAEDRLECSWDDGIVAHRLSRRFGEARQKEIHFAKTPFTLPRATYPEVLLPFLMRGQPHDGRVRAAYAWTSDRFIARVYYEVRHRKKLRVPAGTFDTSEIWMYPDLNDWVAMGGLLTKLAKPLLPRYTMWIERATPHRTIRFEGPWGPPGSPEVVVELVG